VSGKPTLRTARLILGEFTLRDAGDVQRLAGAREIADTTLAIPHPYELKHALAWIEQQQQERQGSASLTFAVRLLSQGTLIGSVGLRDIDPEHRQAELGFWIGRDWWGQGYAREAARAVLRLGFETLELNRICAHHLARNPASGRVLLAIGMQREGLLRQRVRKWGKYEDVAVYAMLRAELNGGTAASPSLRSSEKP
jgi:[ribosomal protein S5]-alanine N-acetyltransferase